MHWMAVIWFFCYVTGVLYKVKNKSLSSSSVTEAIVQYYRITVCVAYSMCTYSTFIKFTQFDKKFVEHNRVLRNFLRTRDNNVCRKNQTRKLLLFTWNLSYFIIVFKKSRWKILIFSKIFLCIHSYISKIVNNSPLSLLWLSLKGTQAWDNFEFFLT